MIRTAPMDALTALSLFHGSWFVRNEPRLVLQPNEENFVNAALGIAPKRWQGNPDLTRMARLLAEHPDVLERIGSRLLTVAISMPGCGPAVAFLLRRGIALQADLNAYNVLHEAAAAGTVDTLQAVFDARAARPARVIARKPLRGWRQSNLPLMYWAAAKGHSELARLLIRHNAAAHNAQPITGNGESGTTPLHEAITPPPRRLRDFQRLRARKLQVARLLLADGAHCDIYAACGLDDAARLRALVEAAPETLHAPDDRGNTPLHWAARGGARACTRILLTLGAKPNTPNRKGRTPLYHAAEYDHAAVARRLTGAGADVNWQDKKRSTPLHRATYEGSVETANFLLKAGADPMLRDKAGRTPFDTARRRARHLRADWEAAA